MYIEYTDDNELYHYGVLGMKWGVRKNPELAYEKANKKLHKLEEKANRRKLKMESIASKRSNIRKLKKGTSMVNANGIIVNGYKDNKRGSKAMKVADKISKATNKYNKAQYKADKWKHEMDKAFKNLDKADYDPKSLERGQREIKAALDEIKDVKVPKQKKK